MTPLLRMRIPLCVAFLACVSGDCPAQSVAVPVETHLPLLGKVMQFDRTFKPRNGGRVVIGVVYQKSWRESAAVCDEVAAVAARPSFSVCGTPVQVIVIDAGGSDVGDALLKNQVDIAYVAPLRGISLDDVRKAGEALHCVTVTGVPGHVEAGIALGIDLRNDRPVIVVNLTAVRSCGAVMSADILRLARVVE